MRKPLGAVALGSIISLIAIGLMPVASAQVGMQTISSSGPLDNIFVGADLACQIGHVDDEVYEFYPPSVAPGDCGTLAFVDGTLYSPNFRAHGATATGGLGRISHHGPVSQSAVTGAGTSASPFAVTTTVAAGPLQIAETDSYVVGAEFYRTDVEVRNTTSRVKQVILYHALDCYLAGSDRGFGLADVAARAPGCRESVDGAPGDRIEQIVPITGGNAYYEDTFSDVWGWIGSHRPFNNTCRCSVQKDNGIGVSWTLNLRGGATTKRSFITTFSPSGRQALTLDKTTDDGTVAPNGPTGYTVTIGNSNSETVTLNSITDTLPEGFTYVPGSTTGATTDDPAIDGRTLTWTGSFPVASTAASGDPITLLHFGVTASPATGTFFNEVSADAGEFPVAPSGPTARVIVGSEGCTQTGTSGNDTLTGTPGADVICGLGGSDRIVGRAGTDLIRGGPGNDDLGGGGGDDRLFGAGGNDGFDGGGGSDLCDQGPGRAPGRPVGCEVYR